MPNEALPTRPTRAYDGAVLTSHAVGPGTRIERQSYLDHCRTFKFGTRKCTPTHPSFFPPQMSLEASPNLLFHGPRFPVVPSQQHLFQPSPRFPYPATAAPPNAVFPSAQNRPSNANNAHAQFYPHPISTSALPVPSPYSSASSSSYPNDESPTSEHSLDEPNTPSLAPNMAYAPPLDYYSPSSDELEYRADFYEFGLSGAVPGQLLAAPDSIVWSDKKAMQMPRQLQIHHHNHSHHHHHQQQQQPQQQMAHPISNSHHNPYLDISSTADSTDVDRMSAALLVPSNQATNPVVDAHGRSYPQRQRQQQQPQQPQQVEFTYPEWDAAPHNRNHAQHHAHVQYPPQATHVKTENFPTFPAETYVTSPTHTHQSAHVFDLAPAHQPPSLPPPPVAAAPSVPALSSQPAQMLQPVYAQHELACYYSPTNENGVSEGERFVHPAELSPTQELAYHPEEVCDPRFVTGTVPGDQDRDPDAIGEEDVVMGAGQDHDVCMVKAEDDASGSEHEVANHLQRRDGLATRQDDDDFDAEHELEEEEEDEDEDEDEEDDDDGDSEYVLRRGRTSNVLSGGEPRSLRPRSSTRSAPRYSPYVSTNANSRSNGTAHTRTRRASAPSSMDYTPDAPTTTRRRSRQATSLPVPIPVPNLTKKSRGRRVPTVASLEPGTTSGRKRAAARAQDESAAGTGETSGKRGKGLRSYTCKVHGCGKCFARGEHLKRHVRSIHTYEKPHKCPYPGCGKDFSRHDNLGQHMRVHKDYTPSNDGTAGVYGCLRV